jgi:hypothetical protein
VYQAFPFRKDSMVQVTGHTQNTFNNNIMVIKLFEHRLKIAGDIKSSPGATLKKVQLGVSSTRVGFILALKYCYGYLKQGILKGEVSLCH